MTNKDMVADAIKEISKEKQEAEVKKIKDIVRTYLEKIQSKKEKEDEIRKERLALEKDLDDLKAGRLDKIEERQGKDPIHDKVKIIEIHRIEKEYIPYYPWRSPYIIQWYEPNYYYCGGNSSRTLAQTTPTINGTSYSMTSNAQCGLNNVSNTIQSAFQQVSDMQAQTTGVNCQNFVGGSYNINGQIINL
jgi:hypothetical protein